MVKSASLIRHAICGMSAAAQSMQGLISVSENRYLQFMPQGGICQEKPSPAGEGEGAGEKAVKQTRYGAIDSVTPVKSGRPVPPSMIR